MKCPYFLCLIHLACMAVSNLDFVVAGETLKSAEALKTHHDTTEKRLRDKRSVFDQPNKAYQPCKTPAGSDGHCRHIQHCDLAEIRSNFWQALAYLCVIENGGIGVCCPDNISEKASASLPQRGSDDAPVWGASGDFTGSNEKPVVKPEERGCGLSTKTFPKVTGGRPADPGQWPWMAALLRRGTPNAHCGGVLITDRHVLTAAHCTQKMRPDDVFVRLGEYNFGTYNETRARDFRVVDIRGHVDFDPSTYENDISVLKLHQATLFNSYIWPVCMPPTGETWEGWMGIVTGWGTQFFGGPASDVLMEVSLPIWGQESCRSSFNQRITDTVICAGAREGGRDSCQGDSGGPLLVQLPSRRWVVVGIVSWGVRCGEPNHPGIYTRVDSYTQWIIENSVF